MSELDPPEVAPARRAVLGEGKPPRHVSILVGLAMLVMLGLVILRPRRARTEAPPSPPAVAPTGPSPADQLASAMAELQALPAAEPLPLSKIHEALEGAGNSDKGYKLPDGKAPPPLPADAPRIVRIGVVLVRYQGSQLAPANAPSRDDALTRAQTLATIAKADFATAVRGGDSGSTGDIGAVERGILEPGTQYVVFTLPVGSISEILDTPRGFWIVKRLK
ncbi:MAG: peptidylprolyl isomerase [Polyangiales bacterium]